MLTLKETALRLHRNHLLWRALGEVDLRGLRTHRTQQPFRQRILEDRPRPDWRVLHIECLLGFA